MYCSLVSKPSIITNISLLLFFNIEIFTKINIKFLVFEYIRFAYTLHTGFLQRVNNI